MSSKKEDFEAEQKGVYAALCRAALKAKQEAERNGTPYVVAESNTKNQSREKDKIDNNQ